MRSSITVTALVVVGLCSMAVGCTRTFRGHVTQPNPLVEPNETLRDSEKITIITGDMDLNVPRETKSSSQHVSVMKMKRYPLENVASFSVVSRDRLRFHLQLEHKWKEWANPKGWSVYLVDDQGRVWRPETTEHARTRHLVTMWDQEVRTVYRDGDNQYGDIIAMEDDGYKNRVPLGSLSVFQGRADFVFYERDIFTPDVKWMKLVAKKSGTVFEFRWDFDDDEVASSD
jgi:hypothetical protein